MQACTCHSTCVESENNLGCWSSISILSETVPLFTAVYARIAGPQASRAVSVFISHLAVGALGLQAHTSMSSFTWLLGIRTQVFTLGQHHLPTEHFLCPLPTLPQKAQTSAVLGWIPQIPGPDFIPNTMIEDDPATVLQAQVKGQMKAPRVVPYTLSA